MKILEGLLGVADRNEVDLLLGLALRRGAVTATAEDWQTAHPLVTPLYRDAGGVVGLLHWPTPDEHTRPPVVRCRGAWLEVEGLCVRDAARRVLARWETAGGATDDAPAAWWSPGERAASSLPDPAWEVQRAGGSPSAFRALAARHEARGDRTAALIALELWSERHAGWAAPHADRMALLDRLGRPDAARDAATHAMGLPLWTLDRPWAEVAARSGWRPPIDGAPYERLANDAARPPADRAAWWMDWAVATGAPWPEVRRPIADLYREAGLDRIAALVDAHAHPGTTPGA